MGDPINPKRAGELWDERRLAILRGEILSIRGYVTVSGGWAWHFLSQPGHTEFKTTHDHKDIDVFVDRTRMGAFVAYLRVSGYERTWTRFDGKTEGFARYSRERDGVKVIIDVFTEAVPSIEANEGIRVVEPATLLGYYGKKLSSDACQSVRAARRLLGKGVPVLNHPDLTPSTDLR